MKIAHLSIFSSVMLIFLQGCNTNLSKKKLQGTICTKKPGYTTRHEMISIPSCSKKPLKTLTMQELSSMRLYYSAKDDAQKQIAIVERMMSLSNDPQQLQELQLALSDLYYQTHQTKKASRLYNQYSILYPGSHATAYATYQAMVCLFENLLDNDRDQTATMTLVGMAQDYSLKAQQHATGYEDYLPQVQTILVNCQKKLIDHELNIINFYKQQGNIAAAQARLSASEKQLLELEKSAHYDTQPKIIALQAQLYDQQANTDQALSAYQQLASSFAGHDAATDSKTVPPSSKRDIF